MQIARLLVWGAASVAGGVLLGRLVLVDLVTVSSHSMLPTYCHQDRLLVLREPFAPPTAPGDVVVFHSPVDGSPAVKRVAAVAGQEVVVRDGVLHVDGRARSEPYVDSAGVDGTWFGPVTVPPSSLFLLGDHRERSIDSRDYGAVAESAVMGKVLVGWRRGPGCDSG